MEIRKPKFELGQRVIDKKGDVGTVINVSHYYFDKDEYWYNIEKDETIRLKPESNLEPYKDKTVWELEVYDKCFFVTSAGNILDGIWDELPANIGHREIGNLFLTKEEAENEVERRKIEVEMIKLGGRREFKNGENNYYIACDFDSSQFAIRIFNNKSDGFALMTIYFDSAKECRNAIEKIGEDRIKRYIFKLGISCNEN